MTTVRWVRGDKDRSISRDQDFPTKADALLAIKREQVSSIVKAPTAGGVLYVVQIKSKS